ncbi:MAG: hypothetical protein WBP90_02865 [Terracidiphilus sp.]
MSDADQNEPNQGSVAGGQSADSGEAPPVSKFDFVPVAEKGDQKELYSFRETMEPPPAEPDPKRQRKKKSSPIPIVAILLVVAVLAGAVLIALEVPSFLQPKPPVPYIDLGSQRYDPAGLSGRFIARWNSSGGSYQFFLDPLDPQQIASFAAVAQDPSRQLSVTFRIRDAEGLVACQKQILFPDSVARTPGTKFLAPREPRETQNGDIVQNMTGEDGQIAEIDLTGPLPCPVKAYSSFKSWEFYTNFPTLAEQAEWLRHEVGLNPNGHGGRGESSPRSQRLPTAIEGDDVIVGDNPSRGTVETGGGRVFFLGIAGLRNRSAEWQVFPAPIHFRCDRTGSCVLTRANSNVSLQARLIK